MLWIRLLYNLIFLFFFLHMKYYIKMCNFTRMKFWEHLKFFFFFFCLPKIFHFYKSSSLCRATSTDLPNPLSPSYHLYRSSLQGGLPGYILYRYRAVVYMF